MLSFAGSLRVFVALEACDRRAGFHTLQGLVAEKLREDIRSGARFVFSNRRHHRLKILYWDGPGLWLLTKRLEAGTFSWPRPAARAPSPAPGPGAPSTPAGTPARGRTDHRA